MRGKNNNIYILRFIAITFFYLLLCYDVCATNTNYKYRYPRRRAINSHKHVLAASFSTSFESYTGVGLQEVYTYRIHPVFSLGFQGNFLIEGSDDYINKRKSIFLGARFAYHPLVKVLDRTGFDVYLCSSVGTYYRSAKFVFKPLAYLCVSYDLIDCIGFHLEIGSTASIGLRYHF